MFRNRFFKLDGYDLNKNPLRISDFYELLSWIINEYSSKPYGIGLGALTADRRDNWTEVYIKLTLKFIFSEVNFFKNSFNFLES